MAIQAQMYPDNFASPLLGGSQDCFVMDTNNNNSNFFNSCSNFNDFSFNLQQQQQQQQFQSQQQFLQSQFQNLQQRNFNNPTINIHSISSQIQKQSQEIDSYLSLQNKRLRVALQEQRKQHLEAILKKVEDRATVILTQKDDEILKARKRRIELEYLMNKMEAEKNTWQRVASENELMVFSLSSKLEELKEQVCCMASSNGVDDSESCCEEETGENRGGKNMCRSCNCRNACVVLLPCRHLCCCNACEAVIDYCPLCKSPKKGTIQALFNH